MQTQKTIKNPELRG